MARTRNDELNLANAARSYDQASTAELRPMNQVEQLQQQNEKLQHELVERDRELLGLYRRLNQY